MKCFHHSEIDAVGICKECNKGICTSCATDLGHGLACKGKHEPDVELIHNLISRQGKAIAMQQKSVMASNISWLIMGLIFLAFGLFQKIAFLTVFGGFCAAYWVYLAAYNSAAFKKLDS